MILTKIKRWLLFLFIAVMLVAVTAGATMFFSEGVEQKHTTITVEQIHQLSALATAEAQVTLVKQEVENKLFGNDISVNFPGTKREILLIIPASVLAGVDLKNVTPDKIVVDEEEKKLSITLPHATFLQDPTIHMEDVKTFSDKGLLSGEVKWDEGFELAAIAQDEIKQEAIGMGILATAEDNATTVLTNFFNNLGYSVEITFE